VTVFSVIIPTYERRATVVRSVLALERQRYRDFEVVVVVDGSRDGTAQALRALEVAFALRLLEQPNRGRAAACNAGAAAAAGDVLLFLDDDMEADPALLAEHDRSRRQGADVVLGHMPLHPGSPRNVLSEGVGMWTDYRLERLTAPGEEIPIDDLLTGQLSICRATFARIGGFDTSFTRDGLFGGEDLDFGYRLVKAGCRVTFNPAAISYQRYDVDPATYLRRAREAGRSAHELSAKHPERAAELQRRLRVRSLRDRILALLAVTPPRVTWPLEARVVELVRSGRCGARMRRLFFALGKLEELRGARWARRDGQRAHAVVLAWHAIADLRHDPVLRDYGVPPERFAAQLDALIQDGRRFIGLPTLMAALDGQHPLPPRAVLVTFDDAYADLLTAALPILTERRIPALAFAVSDRVGTSNDWDRPLGAGVLSLLDAEGLRTVAANGVVVGSHGATHRALPTVARGELEAEVAGSAATLQALGLPRPTAFAYPHGELDGVVVAAVRSARYEAAFTVCPGVVRSGANRHAIPRLEVLADTPRTLVLRVATAAWPDRRRRALLWALRAAG
jgi:GT2 family glycosyltransferase/peptidoglycan/xylan/chitin deacetylase (PgdA/CDA1 family)